MLNCYFYIAILKIIYVFAKKRVQAHLKMLSKCLQRCPRGVMVEAMDCGIVVREFVLQLRYYVHFRINTLGKGMNPLILPAMG